MKTIEQLQEENAALLARVSRMSTFIKLSAAKWENCHEVYPTFWNLLRVANEAPQQHLAEVKAQAGRAGFVAGYLLCNDGSALIKHNYEGFADQYAEQIRRSEV